MSFKTISVIGLGYIGLPTAAMFAESGINVIGVDVNHHAVDTINRGEIHIVEPGLGEIVSKAVAAGTLKAVTTPEPADAFLIAVPTPFLKTDSSVPVPDISYIMKACIAIAPVLKKGDLVILESTSPVGATEKVTEWLADLRPELVFPKHGTENADVNVSHCPERVLPGKVIEELVSNDRIIGGITPLCSQRSVELYKIFVKGNCIVTNARTAEMAKLTENASRDVSIAFANELSMICDEAGINVWELIELANLHPRVNILQPGPGVGGHCIAVDPWFIVSKSPVTARLIKSAREINDSKPKWVVQKVKQAAGELLLENVAAMKSKVTIACYGLAFKPDIDDLRESPSLTIAKLLSTLGDINCICVEPNISLDTQIEGINLVSLDTALTEADIHVMLVDHKEFKVINKPVGKIIDMKGVWEGYRRS
ncbi:UDP-N-acetyl-D-mannosamine dehydrogenase [Glaciecola sp. XM2]|uniref:UDP-N-acetyl-D-mannosamine dehydrogenase n=1 Tax=Glaciecola sp. XM2 TaxID=1914931 RepID=UPI001BDEFAA8|nr:UDP-N-acetyl-D-mannosamine dehydrogenase [Glaciecola sp. XM2]MBT1450654.1 UDP-N-acetyl-D-mannosamine dehydrogenase [Glaciecola sp. XM2]